MFDIGLCYKYDLSVFCLLTFRNSSYAFFYKQHFISNARLTFEKNQAKAKQHPEFSNCCYLKIIRIIHPCYHPKIVEKILKDVQKTSTPVKWGYMNNDNENEAENEKQIT